MTGSDSYDGAFARQNRDTEASPSPETTAMQVASHADHARTHARCLTQDEADALVRDVAGLLCEEQRCGSFGNGLHVTVDSRLSGACCIAAAIVTVVLIRRGVPARVTGGRPHTLHIHHWWAESHDGWILDPTFGQFWWSVDPLAVHVSSPRARELYAFEKYDIEDFMSWRGHASLPAENMDVIDRMLVRLTGAPYARD